jgi:pectinesterase
MPRDIVVAANGGGDFKTLQEAVDAAPANSAQRTSIDIKPGTYNERITVPKEKTNIHFDGEDAATTVLTFNCAADTPDAAGSKTGTFNSASVFIFGDNFSASNITFQNTYGKGSQALAIHVTADRAVFRKCRFDAWQDTVLLDKGRQYFEDCFIEGHVDFIFGGATAFFERCEIHCRERGCITAASTPQEEAFGFVFSHCKVTAEPGTTQAQLGRPWRPYASVIFLNTELPAAIDPPGWNNWKDPEREKTARFAEFKSTGPGANPAARVPWSKQLTATEAAAITPAKVLAGNDGWNPQPAK